MALAGAFTGIDMNDAMNLNLYTQMVRYKDDLTRQELLLKDRTYSERKTLHSLADGLALEFEYSKATRIVTISRIVDQPPHEEVLATHGSAEPEELRKLSEEEMLDSMNRELDETLERLKSQERVAFGLNHTSPLISSGSYHPVAEVSSSNHPILASGFDHLMQELAELTQSTPVAVDTTERRTLPNSQGDILPSYPEVPASGKRKNSQRSPSPPGSQSKRGSGVEARSAQPSENHSVSQNEGNMEHNEDVLASSQSDYNGPPLWDSKYVCSKCDEVFTEDNTYWKHYMEHFASAVPDMSHTPASDGYPDMESFALPPYVFPPPVFSEQASIGSGFVPSYPYSPQSVTLEGMHEPEMGPLNKHAVLDNYPSSQHQSRTESCHSASSSYKEIVFDSKSVHSGSQVSAGSAGSGRHGPLSDWARAGMNAVREVGACWKCQFLRKKCNALHPCTRCLKGKISLWTVIRCQRGLFTTNPVTLCPVKSANLALIGMKNDAENKSLEDAIKTLKIAPQYDDWLDRDVQLEDDGQNKHRSRNVQVRQLYLHTLEIAYRSMVFQPLAMTLNPLVACILGTVWQSVQCEIACVVLNDCTVSGAVESYGSLARLLTSAAIYQAKDENNEKLIAQSLICLRSCAEALRLREAGLLDHAMHRNCSTVSACSADTITSISLHLEMYMKELSRLFFDKDNMRSIRTWWLSAFYSFCIQSLVRKTLIKLTENTMDPGRAMALEYLHLQLRLFIAVSGRFDPLKPGHELAQSENFQLARKAVNQAEWQKEHGVNSSKAYLSVLFQD